MSFFNIEINIDNLIINVVLSGETESIYNGTSYLHTHHSFEFHYVRKGTLEFELGEKRIISDQGKIYLISPMTYHAVKARSPKLKRISLIFALKEDKLRKTDFDAYTHYTNIFSKATGISELDIESSYLDDLFECQEDFVINGKFDYEMFRALFIIIFKKITAHINGTKALFHSKCKNDFSDDSGDAIRAMNAEHFMETHYRDEISIDDLAAYLNLSTRQTMRFLKEHMNISFNDFIRKCRIELAKTLLMEFDISVMEIAEMVGYKSYNGFFGAFKHVTGQTPTEFLENKS